MSLAPIKLERISENDFDGVVAKAGGRKIDDGTGERGEKSADYLLNDVVIELKIVEEEGLNKPVRQKKIADLFREQFPDHPVVVIDPYIVGEDARSKLYRILEGPMKTLVKKASKQLAQSADKHGAKARVLIIFNNGFMSLNHSDFERLVLKCVRNDTRHIDLVIIGGMYFHYDGFDHYMNFHFQHHVVNAAISPDLESLDKSWGNFVSDYMRDSILNATAESPEKLASADVSFDVSGVTYVRPRPQVGKPSPFFVHGRPRENSTGIERCPAVAEVLPVTDAGVWATLKSFLNDGEMLPTAPKEWLKNSGANEVPSNPLKPVIAFHTDLERFKKAVGQGDFRATISDFKLFSCEEFSSRCRDLADAAQALPENLLIGSRFILVETMEIGSDKAFDFSSISLVSDIPGFERKEELVVHERIFFDHALCLGAAYAVRNGCDAIFTLKNTDFGWV